MSLPPLLKHVYNHGTEEVVRRGKKIFYTSGVSLLDIDHLLEQVRFRVRNDLYQNYYTVTVTKYLSPRQLAVRCQCPYNLGEICRHEVAALFQLNDMMQSGILEQTDITYDQKHTIVRMRQVSPQNLRIFTDPQVLERASELAARQAAVIISRQTDRLEAEVPDGGHTYQVGIRQNEERYFDTTCGCAETSHPLCLHKTTVFLQVLNQFGNQFFQTMRNWDEQKNLLLRQYGYSLQDDLSGKFSFTYENGKPFLRVLDPSIQKVHTPQPAAPVAAPQIPGNKREPEAAPARILEEKHLGIVLDTSVSWYPFVRIGLVCGPTDEERQRFLGPVDKIELQQYVNGAAFPEGERDLIPLLRKFTPEEILKYLRKNMPFGDFFLDDYNQVLREVPADDVQEQVWEYLLPKYQRLLERFAGYGLTYILKHGRPLKKDALHPIALCSQPAHPRLHIATTDAGYRISLLWELEGMSVQATEVRMLNPGLLIHNDRVYSLGSLQELQLAARFAPEGFMDISAEAWPRLLSDEVMAWSKLIHIDFAAGIVTHITAVKPGLRLYLQEREQMMLFFPVFVYNGAEVPWGHFGEVIVPMGPVVHLVSRQDEAEQEWIRKLRNLHSDMQQNLKDHFLYLPAQAVLAHNWFFRFTDEMKESGAEILGHEGLKSLRISTHRPDTRVQVSSGIDWFDASVELVFGDQTVSIAEVKRALAQRLNYVKLGDGSVGLLPEEWLKKYALLIKMGEARGNKLRIKKIHFSVLDELLAEIDEEELQNELEEKKERLAGILEADFSAIAPPASLQADLRPYQLAGFQWLAFLREAGWGGILADDMGLGKTIQTLAFFQYIKDQDPDANFLVVCPTTLVYNWEAEIRKFTPGLTHFIHHGPKRQASPLVFGRYDVIITTYGTMRSDIRLMREFKFAYVVLDESQAIKNPQSQVAKASLLINATNRLALSGTPVQNNTFDLFAQMNFLNPGMLGSREFFMNEFATPIDKFQEDETKAQLRRLIYPFMLRRTKEQVAKDLPEKTETLLFCEMGKEQRRIYDAYRNDYKSKILGMIDERGIERSQMHILQGLTRLRQICDSPAILNEQERFPNHSVKIDELMREISENVNNHKALVFSQFLGMLALIRQALEQAGIPYVYFDGSTSTSERERAIQTFQNNEDCRVFLISLKAGGVGLNLTAADYVYIVDPWWNPAVEQQAIDRTHRIGQQKNIFAYRLICKDTIEEKMLVLQDRKRALASDLVADDNAVLKRLTRDDIAYLLS